MGVGGGLYHIDEPEAWPQDHWAAPLGGSRKGRGLYHCTVLILSKGKSRLWNSIGLYHMETGKRMRAVPFWKVIVIGTTDQYLIAPQGSQGVQVIYEVASCKQCKGKTNHGPAMIYGGEVDCTMLTHREEGERASESSGGWTIQRQQSGVGLYHIETPRGDT